MAHLIDTSALTRQANTTDVAHATAARAVGELHRLGEMLHVTAQNLVEFRNVAHFARLAGSGPGVVIVDPASV